MAGEPDSSGDTESRPGQSLEATRAERRRRQNRLNQQAWRQRQRCRREAERQQDQADMGMALPPDPVQHSTPALSTLLELIRDAREPEELQKARSCRLTDQNLYQLLAVFESAAYRSYREDPRVDHRLTLGKLNVFRAFVRNIAALGYTREWMTDDALSYFSIDGPHHPPGALVTSWASLPASLRPTKLQQSQPHHPWLDFFPFAQLRDNLIHNEDTMDDSSFCRDLMGFWNMPEEDNCILVWGNPWDPMCWEITETFLRKWGWLIKGCPEIIWSTNYWRQIRGLKRLNWRSSFDRLIEGGIATSQ